jgi:DNA-binding response OmpR family regulator
MHVSNVGWKAMKKILIVEDDPDLQYIIKSVLRRAGFDVEVYSDGRSLMEPFVIPDLFIFDIELPFMNGLDLCRRMKADEQTSHVPVLIVSASATLLSQAKDACADAAFPKPVDARELVNQVNALLNPHR